MLLTPTRIPNAPILEFELPPDHPLIDYMNSASPEIFDYVYIQGNLEWPGNSSMIDLVALKFAQQQVSAAFDFWSEIMKHLDVELMKSIATPAYIKIKIK